MAAAFFEARADYYVKNGKQTNQLARFRTACEFPVKYYGSTIANEFGPKRLLERRNLMETSGRFSRRYINTLITCFRSVVKFGVERELVRPETLTALQAIAPLKRGRSVAGELPPVQAVDARIVDATREAMAGFRFREKDNKRDPGYYGKYYEAGWAPNGRKVTVPDHFLRKAKKKNKPRLERELDEAMGDYREMLAEYMRRRNYNQNLKKPK